MADMKHTIPPRDSWIQLSPGAQITIDARLAKEWKKRAQECREIRGNVLAKCFEIEYVLDRIIAETLMPSSIGNEEERDLFTVLFLKGPATSFRGKIDVLQKLWSQVPRLQAVLSKKIVTRLTAVREVRNDFAHYPVTFEPTGEPPNQTLLPVLVSRRGRFVLDEAFLHEQGENFDSVFRGLEGALKALRPDDPQSGENA